MERHDNSYLVVGDDRIYFFKPSDDISEFRVIDWRMLFALDKKDNQN